MLLTETSLIYRGIRPLQKLGATAKDLALNNPLAGIALPQRVPKELQVVPPDPWAGDAQQGRDMISGVFRFAGQTVSKEELSWRPEKAHDEWVAELHGFEWLRDLRSAGGDRARRMAREMVGNWIEQYQKYDALAWRPDITGVRVAAWITFHDFFCAAAGDDFRKGYFASLARQVKHLARTLPHDLSGIPLMKALKGLAYAGLAIEEDDHSLEQAFKLIFQQIREQILPDGGHISRSPQAAFEFLLCLVDLRVALTAAKLDVPDQLQHAIDRIAPAVKFFRHGDGGLAHFNGALEGNANFCDVTLMHSGAKGRAMKSLPHSGYERICLGRSSVMLDAGTPLVSRYSDRAHAGLLSFEYSFGKERVFVNCGTSEIKGKWRDLLRSTAAHSTIVVDQRNSSPFDTHGLLSGRPEVRVRRHEDEGVMMIEASHSGYVPRFGLTHRRCVRLQDDGETLLGEDQLLGKSGVHFAVRFHLHPNIQASLIQEGSEILLRAKSGTGWRFRTSGVVDMKIEESVYAGAGETPRRTAQVVLSGVSSGSSTIVGWELRRERI